MISTEIVALIMTIVGLLMFYVGVRLDYFYVVLAIPAFVAVSWLFWKYMPKESYSGRELPEGFSSSVEMFL
jgi:hypothetical protein